MRVAVTVLSVFVLCWAAACGDDDPVGSKTDGAVGQQDAAVVGDPDAGLEGDASRSTASTDAFPTEGGYVSGMTCAEVSTCFSENCNLGNLITCKDACNAKGCAGAATLMDATLNCLFQGCVAECGGGYGEVCQQCIDRKCKAENDACQQHSC